MWMCDEEKTHLDNGTGCRKVIKYTERIEDQFERAKEIWKALV